MSGIPRSREGELLKKEKGPLGAKWTRKLVVVDGRKGTVRYHRPTDDKSDVPRKIFHLKSMTLIEDCIGPKKAPHALELRDLKGYSLILACERGAAEKEAWRSLLAPLCAGGTPPVAAARTTSNDWVDPQSKPPEEDEPWPVPQTFDSALAKPFETYEATFLPDQPLGIQLRLEPEVDGKRAILVLEVKDTCPQKGTIHSGDELVGVQGEPPLTPRTTDEFKKCTTELARKPRPLVLVFRREVSETPFDEPDDSPKVRDAASVFRCRGWSIHSCRVSESTRSRRWRRHDHTFNTGALLRRGPSFTCRGRARAAERDLRAAAVIVNFMFGS